LLKSPTPEPDAARSAKPTTLVPLPKTKLDSSEQTVAEDAVGVLVPIEEMLPNTVGCVDDVLASVTEVLPNNDCDCVAFLDAS